MKNNYRPLTLEELSALFTALLKPLPDVTAAPPSAPSPSAELPKETVAIKEGLSETVKWVIGIGVAGACIFFIRTLYIHGQREKLVRSTMPTPAPGTDKARLTQELERPSVGEKFDKQLLVESDVPQFDKHSPEADTSAEQT